MLKHLPNAMTCGNLLCGCLGIVQVFNNQGFNGLPNAAFLIIVAALLDFGDGFVARLVNAQSEIGKQLDSLADMVTFGVLPACMLFQLLPLSSLHDVFTARPDNTFRSVWVNYKGISPNYIAFSIAIFSALRLAKFNIDTRQTDQFIGVPTPANALVVASMPLMAVFQPHLADYVLTPWFLYGYIVLMSYLLVAEIPLLAFKFKSFGWRENRVRYSFLLVSAGLLATLWFAAVPLILLLYIIVSLFSNERISE
jgi:CDP-diacylglycerol---serine O-phosphatidyltransferase